MPRHLSTLRSLTALTAFATLSTASAEERGKPQAPQTTTPARTGNQELLAGTYSVSIPAITCVHQGSAPPPAPMTCGGGGTLRTDGDNTFPCAVNSNATLNTYVCGLNLPSGAQIQEAIAYGYDSSTVGYFEAAIWSTADATLAVSYFSSFGGTWQNSGVAFNSGYSSFPIFSASQPAHTVVAGNRYVIGFATRDPIQSNLVFGFRVRYSLP